MFRKKNSHFNLKEMICSHFKQVDEVIRDNQKKSEEFERYSKEILKKIRNNENDFQ